MVRNNCIKTISTKIAIIILKRKPIMYGYIISYRVDLNENGNFKEWKLIIHGYKNAHGDDLNENDKNT